jgi:hypothetical protein
MTSPVAQITDHVDRMKADLLGQFQDDPIALAICDVIGTEIQRLETLLYSVLTKILMDNAKGAILDRIGKIVRKPRLGLDDDDYRAVIRVQIAAYNSDSGVDQIMWIVSQIVGVLVEYRKYPPAAYRLAYETDDPLSDELTAEAAKLMGISTSAGVGFQLVEGTTDDSGAFRFDIGPGFDVGHLAVRKV